MTATTLGTVCTLLKYELPQQSFPRPKRDKSILIQSDCGMLSQAICDSLQHTCHQMLSNGINLAYASASADLIILALSGPDTLPVVALTRASIVGQVGRTPIVVLSQHPFDSSEAKRIYSLPLPVEPAALRHQIQALLE